jgi:hypothetical protein
LTIGKQPVPNFSAGDLTHVKSLVDSLGYELQPSILIGGWASWTHIQTAMSADIDAIIGSDEVRSKLQSRITDLSSNSVHQGRKLRGTVDGVHIDIYLPYESRLGQRLQLRTEVLSQYVAPGDYHGWLLLTREAHLITKLAALLDRPRSAKGQKDADEILTMLRLGLSAQSCVEVLQHASAAQSLSQQVDEAFGYLAELVGRTRADRDFLSSIHKQWRAAFN